MNAPSIFISYSHKDEKWKDRLRTHLKVLELNGRISIWDDRDIDVGGEWYDEIRGAMDRAAVAVCLISADYLASDFCHKEEIPHLLGLRKDKGMILIPILLRPCPWKAVPWLKKTQMLPRDGKSVSKDFKGDEDEVFAEVAENIFEILDDANYQPPPPPPSRWSPPEKIDIGRLPVTGKELFGRQAELEMLDSAWESEDTNVVSLVAWGGVGKSTLVNKWLEQMEADNYRDARRVYAWSFYSQGTNERVTSADLFINNALEWFGDPEPTAGSPWDKGERLARLVRAEETLLVLDGLEPLQSPHAHERGKIKDPALSTLLNELARENQGLCLITTRERVTDLEEFTETVLHKDLEQISDEAGRALLRVGGVRGTDAELEQAVRDFGNHALAVQLLAVYLHDIDGHHVSHAAGIPDLDIPVERGRHPRRMLAAFEQRFGPGPEVELLRMLGLFDRPADAASLAALRNSPPIPGLTDHVEQLSEADWLRTVEKLRRHKLIAPASTHHADDGTLDAHPLVREHFGEQLKQDFPDAWREGNNRLYEHLRDTTKEFPDTIEEMEPLYAAVAHGCAAGRHQEALDDVYWLRMLRGNAFFNTRKLGAFGANLTTLASFFDPPWHQPVSTLVSNVKGFILNEAGFVLGALGRLIEATQPMQAALEAHILQEDWANAAQNANNLSESHLTIGDLPQALLYARKSIELADRSGNSFHRMDKRTALADVLYRMGRMSESESAICEAEEMQKNESPEFPFLYSIGGFRYCNLLLHQGKYADAQIRASITLQWMEQYGGPLYIALDYLSLGRAYLLQAKHEATDNFLQATDYLNRAVNGIRQAGTLQYLPLGLMARAESRLIKGELDHARTDLDEAMSIATRGGMGLYLTDSHLEYARLHLAGELKDVGKAREHLETARGMIERMGYHLRDEAVRELEAELEEA